MTRTLDARTTRPRASAVRPVILAALTLAAMLLCLLAVHSAGHGAGHDMPAVASSSSMTAVHSAAAHVAAAQSAVADVAADVAAAPVGASGGAMLAMTCSILLALAAVVVLARRPSLFQRLLEAGGFVVGSFRAIPLHLHRPSLTLLSISRV
ncbi:hypothetical protein E3T37_00985 [Cryobacterium sp. TMT2-10]|uniref:Uncharacterized protein n=1 Tax=Cryobacterium shii TaxID=1259235 RepID=A0AAQ2C7C7_9MICO|nr:MULTISPECIES: hypothetical protein [Cryobacterium]TFC48870.1 hypothetical protein E3O49_06575 [Cryobacterium shii]TFD17259.1 hypothetical protein E3T42_08160 [Cryobacterium sp. TMT4-10]TFD43356.1 hypothetical protein E3T37_00985 [Cryobacterium sp. TMT2-10]